MYTKVQDYPSCCGVKIIYQLYDAPNNIWLKELITTLSRDPNHGNKLPALVVFADRSVGNARGYKEFLIKSGYKVDEIVIGKNPKSGYEISIWLWFISDKNAGPSLVREYKYEEKQKERRKYGIVGGTKGTRVLKRGTDGKFRRLAGGKTSGL